MSEGLEGILSVLNEPHRRAVRTTLALFGGNWSEMRLYAGEAICLLCGEKNIRTSAICSADEIHAAVRYFCGNSLYAHSETIREGYIYTRDGLRVGVAGRAVVREGKIEYVTDITSLCVRHATRIPGAADALYPLALRADTVGGILVYAPPGVGKTTVLRELAFRLGMEDPPVRCAVVDTRQEITCGIPHGSLDVLLGYPRHIGMEIAVRTLAPQIVICDEIASESDAAAVLECAAAGVRVIATAHVGSREDLMRRAAIRHLLVSDVFAYTACLRRTEGCVTCEIQEEAGEYHD